ncbi:MAG: amidase [Roseiflexus sp.]|jgi:aspartyl-tRNA(Asn)/glutamyl-tRNA(Gln) amidotransferase subunit A|uniref:amidase n=1 Tax=Roseiflexus sp. TaxID=2562120 RepID=UPI0025E0D6F8|nr:amidase [Roseiflexus sp.]MCL6539063.1 amidase [Roseiflexus sp.]
MSDLTHLTIAEAADLLARREIASVELTEAHLRRIDAHDTHLNSFITITSDHALTQARAADAELTRGVRRGPLHGIPLALKDLYDTAGIRTTAGSTFFADRVPDTDARAVTLLYQAGAVLLGKLNMHEWALGVTNINPHYGPSRNPWDPSRITGGSSGGAAAALAAGLCMGALGSDTGGSIRIPASLCGIVGLKPTFGRVSLQGVIPLSWNLDHAGPMARTVTDAALLLQAIAGYDPDDPVSVALPVDNLLATLDAGVTGWRIALATDAHFGEADPEVISAVRRAATVFEELGARVEAVDLSQGREAAHMNALMTTSDAAAFHRDRLRDHPHRFGADVLARMERGAQFTSTEYILARRFQSEWRRRLERLFEQFDLLLTPATPITAPVIEGLDAIEAARQLTRCTAPFNLAGLPALSVPCGLSAAGLPIGLQIVAAPWNEARVLRAGRAFENATQWHRQTPPGW